MSGHIDEDKPIDADLSRVEMEQEMSKMDRSRPADSTPGYEVPTRVTAFVDGVFLPPGSGHVLPVIYPATEEQVSELEEAGPATVDRGGGPEWRSRTDRRCCAAWRR
jgi:hypothetical protein